MIAWLSKPFPPMSSSNAFEPVVIDPIFALRSSKAVPVSKLPISACLRAAWMIFAAVGSPISATSASSFGDETAIVIISAYPASANLSAIAGPTPGKSWRGDSVCLSFPIQSPLCKTKEKAVYKHVVKFIESISSWRKVTR